MHLEVVNVQLSYQIRPLLGGPRCGPLLLEPHLGGGPHHDGGLLLCPLRGLLPCGGGGGQLFGEKGNGSLT